MKTIKDDQLGRLLVVGAAWRRAGQPAPLCSRADAGRVQDANECCAADVGKASGAMATLKAAVAERERAGQVAAALAQTRVALLRRRARLPTWRAGRRPSRRTCAARWTSCSGNQGTEGRAMKSILAVGVLGRLRRRASGDHADEGGGATRGGVPGEGG